MVVFLTILIAAMSEGSFTNRLKPIAQVAPQLPRDRLLGVGANGAGIPQVWASRFGRRASSARAAFATMESPIPQEERVALLKKNLRALDGSGEEGKPILAFSFTKFDPMGFITQLRAAIAAAKEMNILLMLHADSKMGERAIAAQVAAMRTAEEFNDIPIHTELILNLSNPQEAGEAIDFYAQAGSDIITFEPNPAASIPSTDQVTAMLDRIRSHGIIRGLVLSPQASVESLEDLLARGRLRMVVIRIGKPTLGDSDYTDKAVDKIKKIKSICSEYMIPEPYISVDGIVDVENAPKFLAEGANVIVTGFSVANVDAVAEAVAIGDPGATKSSPIKFFRTNDPPEDPSIFCWLDPEQKFDRQPNEPDDYICSDMPNVPDDLDEDDPY